MQGPALPPHDGAGRERPWLTPGRLGILVGVLVTAYAATQIVIALRTVLVMLLVAVFMSFAAEPAVQWLARRGWSRGLATGAVFFAAFVVLVGLVAAIVPVALGQASELLRSLPRSVDEVIRLLPMSERLRTSPGLEEQFSELANGLGRQMQSVALGAAGSVIDVGRTAVGLLFQVISIALVAFYLTADGPRARQVLARPLAPDRQRELLAIWELAVQKTGGYIYSRLLLATICTVATAAFLLFIGVPTPLPLGLYVGATSVFIPVVGTYVGGALVLLVAFTGEPIDALFVLIFIVVYQQVENVVLAPRVQARTMDVHPAVAFVSVLIGGTLLGAIGALLALPAAAIIQAVLSTYVRRHQLIDELRDVPLPPERQPAAATHRRARRRAEEAPA